MATGTGKTTVMAMLAAWSILNKVNDRGASRFSDVVLVVCPNVTIRNRLRELDPREGDASLYRTRDLVPPHLMPDLLKGRVLVTNWHVFEPQGVVPGGVSAKVTRAGVPKRTLETITIGARTTTARGRRYLTQEELDRQLSAGLLTVLEEDRDRQGNLCKIKVEALRYVESDTALVNRVLGREVGGKQNILVFNDEAHHAYEVGEDGKLSEEVAVVFGVPFQVIPFKASKGGARAPAPKRHHVHAVPAKAAFEIRFPRVEGYRQAIRNRVAVDWSRAPMITLDPMRIPRPRASTRSRK